MAQVAVKASKTDIPGKPGTLVGPKGDVVSAASTVFADGKAVAFQTSKVSRHGNPDNPRKKGFNPPCASATITSKTNPNILVEGNPIAVIGSVCSCGHIIDSEGVSSVVTGD